jgi:hypothetical protein
MIVGTAAGGATVLLTTIVLVGALYIHYHKTARPHVDRTAYRLGLGMMILELIRATDWIAMYGPNRSVQYPCEKLMLARGSSGNVAGLCRWNVFHHSLCYSV